MNYQLPSRLLVAFSGVLAIAAFLFVLNVWVALAFRQPLETVTPWLWFLPPDAWHLVNPGVFDNALKWGAAAGGAVLAVCLYLASQAPPGEPYGDARWAKRHEIAKAGLLDPSGVILGKLGGPRWFAPFIRSTRDKYCNTLLVAPRACPRGPRRRRRAGLEQHVRPPSRSGEPGRARRSARLALAVCCL